MLVPVGLADPKHVAGCLERRDVPGLIGRVGDDQHDVDVPFRSQSRHRCRPGMLDPQDRRAEDGPDAFGLVLEQGRPRRIRLGEVDRARARLLAVHQRRTELVPACVVPTHPARLLILPRSVSAQCAPPIRRRQHRAQLPNRHPVVDRVGRSARRGPGPQVQDDAGAEQPQHTTPPQVADPALRVLETARLGLDARDQSRSVLRQPHRASLGATSDAIRYATPRAAQASASIVNGGAGSSARQCSRNWSRPFASRPAT